MRVQASSNMVA